MVKGAKPWERIEFDKPADDAKGPADLFRLKVPGGWLVTPGWGSGSPVSPLTFVADAKWEWEPTQDPPVHGWK
jgi:hypothetical protein